MKARPFNTCLVCLCFLLYSSALPRAKDYRPMSSEYVPSEGNMGSDPSVGKEPSCEELRAMWRFSKRQSRAAEITNEIPTYRDPFVYNVWEEYARPRSAGRGGRFRKPPIYGRVVHSAPHLRAPENSPERIRAFEEVARLFGTAVHPVTGIPRRKTSFRLGGGGAPLAHIPLHPAQSGSFQHLKELIRTERARELQEQRMSEEAERSVKAQYGRANDSPPSPEHKGSSNRGVVAFPDILVPPSKYMDDFLLPVSQLSINKYKQRYPDTNTILVWFDSFRRHLGGFYKPNQDSRRLSKTYLDLL